MVILEMLCIISHETDPYYDVVYIFYDEISLPWKT